MNEKSHVAMGYHVCPVCGIKHDEVVLLNKFLHKSFTQQDNFIDFSLCDEHRDLINRDYIAMVELTCPPKGRTASLKDTWESRTGRYLMIRSHVFSELFNTSTSNKLCFIEPELFNKLAEMADKANNEDQDQ